MMAVSNDIIATMRLVAAINVSNTSLGLRGASRFCNSRHASVCFISCHVSSKCWGSGSDSSACSTSLNTFPNCSSSSSTSSSRCFSGCSCRLKHQRKTTTLTPNMISQVFVLMIYPIALWAVDKKNYYLIRSEDFEQKRWAVFNESGIDRM